VDGEMLSSGHDKTEIQRSLKRTRIWKQYNLVSEERVDQESRKPIKTLSESSQFVVPETISSYKKERQIEQ
jgi:hypothetical protein